MHTQKEPGVRRGGTRRAGRAMAHTSVAVTTIGGVTRDSTDCWNSDTRSLICKEKFYFAVLLQFYLDLNIIEHESCIQRVLASYYFQFEIKKKQNLPLMTKWPKNHLNFNIFRNNLSCRADLVLTFWMFLKSVYIFLKNGRWQILYQFRTSIIFLLLQVCTIAQHWIIT